jgi:hypothetical protein
MSSTEAASGVAATLLADGLKRLSKRWISAPTIHEWPSGDTAEGAWELFASFLQRAFKADEPQAIEVKSTPEGWDIVAANGASFSTREAWIRPGRYCVLDSSNTQQPNDRAADPGGLIAGLSRRDSGSGRPAIGPCWVRNRLAGNGQR